MTTREVLLAAADEIERDGWCQGRAHSRDGRHCALGALGGAAPDQMAFDSAKHVLSRWLDVSLFGGIQHWNDQGERTATDVIAALRAAADSVREGR